MKVVLEQQGKVNDACYIMFVKVYMIVSSHWEKRTLNNEVMNGYISRYSVVKINQYV